MLRDSSCKNDNFDIYPRIVPDLYEFLSYVEHKRDILKNTGNQSVDGHK